MAKEGPAASVSAARAVTAPGERAGDGGDGAGGLGGVGGSGTGGGLANLSGGTVSVTASKKTKSPAPSSFTANLADGDGGGDGGQGGIGFGGGINNPPGGVLTINPRLGAKKGSKQSKANNDVHGTFTT